MSTPAPSVRFTAWTDAPPRPPADLAFVVCDANGHIAEASAGFVRLMGHAAAEATGRQPAALLAGPLSDPRALDRLAQAARGAAAPQPLHVLLYARSGQPRWIALGASPAAGGATLLFMDITATKFYETLQHRVLDAMAHALPLVEVGRLLCLAIGHLTPQAGAALLRLDDAGRLRQVAAPALPAALADRMPDPPPESSGCAQAAHTGKAVLHAAGPGDPASCWSHPVTAADGSVLGVLALCLPPDEPPGALHEHLVQASLPLCVLMLERERSQAALSRLVDYDAQTGLPHRDRLLHATAHLLHDACRDGTPLAVAWIALDGRRAVADALGEAAGTSLLRSVAQRLAASARPGDLVARLDGEDAFAVVLPQCNAQRAADRLAHMKAIAGQPLAIGLHTVHPRLRSAAAVHPRDGQDVPDLLRRARAALGPAAGQPAAPLGEDLRAALARADGYGGGSGFALRLQPQLGGPGWQSVTGVQALLHWRHGRLGALAPDRLAALAEDNGLAETLARRALQDACDQFAGWRQAGLPVPRISVVLPAAGLAGRGLTAWLQDRLRSRSLHPAQLCIELPESALLQPPPDLLEEAGALGRIGVGLSLRDFGAGHSSLAALHRLPVVEVKLGPAPMQDTETAALLRIARSLDLRTVAEGVVHPARLDTLALHGCTAAQGDHLAPPMDGPGLARWLAGQPARQSAGTKRS
ncbi:EAL domain-containing protein [Xylophilus sp.]|uniref:EAL domain-containing protein n=1 Tax=Xylophilus sp. TaxID=2653893 RepID=UPI0013BDF001|nr:EAL domain-containing protein [Xylophilus sp.]KAF1044868.1 MAG: Oxygen sensor protein DosP [Xylophilus sp.]